MAAKRSRKKTSSRQTKPKGKAASAVNDDEPIRSQLFQDGLGRAFTLHDDRTRYCMLALLVVCEIVTLCITWSLWETRQSPVNLPIIRLHLPFGILLAASLILALLKPRIGATAHAVLLLVACIDDQYRVQPQMICFAVLILATVFENGLWFGRWYLAAMWTWTGVHKIISPEWLGSGSWVHLKSMGLAEPDNWHLSFAIAVAVVEIALGIAAILIPRRAAIGCIVLHLGVLISLSPLFHNHNVSVWPWNLSLAIVGFWILTRQQPTTERPWQFALIAALWMMPAGFYLNLVNPHLAHVLYSGNEPMGYHTSTESVTRIHGYNGMPYSFPSSPRLFIQTFELCGKPGDKLFIDEPRWGMSDRYYALNDEKLATEIDRNRFYQYDDHEVRGVEIPHFQTSWFLHRKGVTLARDQNRYYSAKIDTNASAEILQKIWQLHNLQELVITNADIGTEGTRESARLRKLEILQFDNCTLSLAAWENLTQAHSIHWIQTSQTPTSPNVIEHLMTLTELEVLRINDCGLDDRALQSIQNLKNLSWLDLKGTKITSAGVNALGKLPKLNWLDVSQTSVDDQAITHLKSFPNLKVLTLSRTNITDASFTEISKLQQLEQIDLVGTAISDVAVDSLLLLPHLVSLDLRETLISGTGIERLQTAMPDCRIQYGQE